MAKKVLSLEEIEAQTALELPNRDMMALITAVVVANDVIDIKDVNVAANVCGVIASNVQCDAQAG